MGNEITTSLPDAARRTAWWLELRGVLAILYGALALARPAAGLIALIAIFTVYAFADGLTSLIAAFRHDHVPRGRPVLFLEGVVGIAAGVIAIARPGIAAIAMVLIVSIRAIIVGLLQTVSAVRGRHALPHPWLLGLAGLCSLGFGIAICARPDVGLLAVSWLVGIYAVLTGVLLVSAALTMRGAVKRLTTLHPAS